MPRKKAFKANQGTVWFLAIIILSALAAVYSNFALELIMIVGICGAIVAIMNITKVEETRYIEASTALVVIITAWKLLGLLTHVMLETFLTGLLVGFGVAGFVLAISLIAKIGLDR